MPVVIEKINQVFNWKDDRSIACSLSGNTKGVHPAFDLALHDLAGVILEKPVYQMLGAKGSKATDITVA